jgi:hypothetical protein
MRFKPLTLDTLTPRQHEILRDINDGPRGANNPDRPAAPSGLFNIMLRAPEPGSVAIQHVSAPQVI